MQNCGGTIPAMVYKRSLTAGKLGAGTACVSHVVLSQVLLRILSVRPCPRITCVTQCYRQRFILDQTGAVIHKAGRGANFYSKSPQLVQAEMGHIQSS